LPCFLDSTHKCNFAGRHQRQALAARRSITPIGGHVDQQLIHSDRSRSGLNSDPQLLGYEDSADIVSGFQPFRKQLKRSMCHDVIDDFPCLPQAAIGNTCTAPHCGASVAPSGSSTDRPSARTTIRPRRWSISRRLVRCDFESHSLRVKVRQCEGSGFRGEICMITNC
jgi:hypothetical protein